MVKTITAKNQTYLHREHLPTPDGNLENAITLIENKLMDIYAENPGDVILMGDMNVDLLTKNSPDTKRYNTFVKGCRLSQLISVPTRISKQKSSLLDHALTNREEYYHQSGTVDIGLTDHALIYIARKRKKIRRIIARIACRNYRRFDEGAFQNFIESIDWSVILQTDDANVAAQTFQKLFVNACDLFAPIKMINLKENAPAWMTGDYLAHVDERKFLSNRCRKSPTSENFKLKDESVQRTKNLSESLQCSFFQETLQNHAGDMKKTWQTIKRFWPYLNKKESPFTGNEADMKMTADTFNHFFSLWGLHWLRTSQTSTKIW